MTEQDILNLRNLAEAGKVQFKERIVDKYDIGCEMVAFSNSHGGKLIIGINDKTGNINALSYLELQETTNLLTNIASENVIPNVLIDVNNTSVADGALVIATIPEGKNKPYHDNKGVIWVKNGVDKRKVFDNSELAEMMSECGNFNPDEAVVPYATIDDLDPNTIKLYLLSRFAPVFKGREIDELNMKDYTLDEMAEFVITGISIEKLLQNLRFIRPDGKLTVAAMLLFGKYTQRWLPIMTAKCISYIGNSIGGTQFRDKMHDMEIEGNLLHQFRTIMNFFTRNLRKVQVEKEFNSLGELEIPYESLTEYVINALVHRSLNVRAPIRIFIFDNRVEIHSPGALPNGLTIEDIKNGTSMPRNMFLFTNANYLLPNTGAGSGVRRALSYDPDVIFSNGINDSNITHHTNEFLITIPRNSDQVQDNYNIASDQAFHYTTIFERKTDPAQSKTDPAQSKTDPAQSKTDPAQSKTDPVQSKTDPAQSKNRPSSVKKPTQLSQETDPAQSKTDPAQSKTDPVQSKTDPAQSKNRPSSVKKPTQLSQKTDPAQSKTDPAQSKTDPAQSKTDPAQSANESFKYKLSKKQQDIRNFCSIPRNRQEILQRAGVSDHFDNRKKYIYDLVDAGVLERTIPDKPNDPNQKYRKTRKFFE